MAKKRHQGKGKKHYTPSEANAMLPLVRRIVEDIATLAHDLRERHSRLAAAARGKTTVAHDEETDRMKEELDRDGERLQGYVTELAELGVELKDYFQGLVDFRSWRDDQEVYLCWKLGEPRVAHWHELNAGFAGRRQLVPDTSKV